MHTYSLNSRSKSKNILILSLLTSISAIGCILLGYLFLPLAAASYATLLFCEKKDRRIVSIILPVVFLVINTLLNGFFSLEATAYVAVGFLMFIFFKKERKKCEAVAWITALMALLIIISFIFLGFKSNNSASFTALGDYIYNLYTTQKNYFIDFFMKQVKLEDDSALYLAFTAGELEEIYHLLVLMIPSVVMIIAFILTGFSFKVFSMFVYKYSDDDTEINKWTLIPPRFITVTYLVFAVLNLFASSSEDLFSITVSNIYTVLLVVFAYLGFKFMFMLLSARRGGAFAFLLLAVALVILQSNAVLLLSFVGIYFSFILDKKQKE